jgi:type VI secretion system secreted protein Hcp
MAASIILDIPSIPGESNDAKYAGKIEIDSFDFGQTQTGSSAFGSATGAGRVHMNDFSFTKHADKSSPKLMEKCASGEHIPSATLILRRSGDTGGDLVEYFRAEFSDLMVSSYQTSGADGDSGLPVEQIAFNFAAIKVTYSIQKKGAAAGRVMAGYDVRQNVVI